MEYCILGQSTLRVSRLALGTVPFGTQLDDEACRSVLEAYLDEGGNFIDTANVYGGGLRGQSPNLAGASERAVGRVVKGVRDKLIIATKGFSLMGDTVAPDAVGLSRRYLTRELEASLRRLETDYIDLYQCHGWDFYTPVEETLAALEDFVSAGKIRAVGVSNWDGWQVVKARGAAEEADLTGIASNQIWYNLADRGAENAIIPACQDQKVAIIAWGVLAQGFLSGRYKRGDHAASGSRFELMKEGESSAWSRLANDRNWTILELLAEIARAHGRTVSNVATRWLLQSGTCDVALIGGTDREQYQRNLGALGFGLSVDEVDQLRRASEPDRPYPVDFQLLFGRRESPFYGNMR